MNENRTIADILERVRESRRRKRCPHCDGAVSIRGFRGEYRWECLNCDAIGIGFTSRSDALQGVQKQRR
ncbi:hypothetical protein ACFO5R_14255 [Halosolutus amylolyticus]|uniref:Transposase n=1 Tax=Halosolutus amylolyticus TaxID=2932267 RepID=A0ABD5PRI6_9EURY|nr:hypothetical protein [Halosolutus amylolyticus]